MDLKLLMTPDESNRLERQKGGAVAVTRICTSVAAAVTFPHQGAFPDPDPALLLKASVRF